LCPRNVTTFIFSKSNYHFLKKEKQPIVERKFNTLSVKTILVSQPRPETEKSPYFDLAEKFKLKIDFRPFIHVEGVDPQEFRQSRINIAEYTAVVLNSRNAIDHYFRMAKEMRFLVPDSMKYFCTSEAVAYYLQKYVVYRKRKIFFGKQTANDLVDVMKKHKNEKFLFPCSDAHNESVPSVLQKAGFNVTKAVFYKTVCSDLSDLANVNYDMLAFFSPSGIESLYKNFPKFKQNKTKIAIFGENVRKAAEEKGLKVDVFAPTPETPSMTMAIEKFVQQNKK
jgi:uroporphyrinogen-III synthase